MLRDVEDHPVGVLELPLEIALPLIAQIEEECAAGLLDAPSRLVEIVDLKAEVMRADEARGVLEIAALGALEIEKGEVDHAVGHIDRRADLEILALDPPKIEDLLVKSRGLVEIFDANRDVTQASHANPPQFVHLHAIIREPG